MIMNEKHKWLDPRISFDGISIITLIVGLIWFGAHIEFRVSAEESAQARQEDHIQKIDVAIAQIAQNEAVLNAILQERTGKPEIINNTTK